MCKGPEVRVDSCVGRTARSPGWSEQSEWEESGGMLRAQGVTGARWDLMGGGEVGGFPSEGTGEPWESLEPERERCDWMCIAGW